MPLGALLDPLILELRSLTAAGVLGLFDYFEVTELVAFPKKGNRPINVLSVIVAEEGGPVVEWAPKSTTLSSNLISLHGLKDWRFGVFRYAVDLTHLEASLRSFSTTGVWALMGKSLALGPMEPIERHFAPADSQKPRAWNGVLKNNFWNGSHILELSDVEKQGLAPLLAKPERLQDLSDHIRPFCPLEIARASDRLGNIIIQLPVTAISASLGPTPPSGQVKLDLAWHPGIAPRPLRLGVERHFDGMIVAASSTTVGAGLTPLPFVDGRGLQTGALWDDANGVILWSQAPSAFIRQAGINLMITRHERRSFGYPDRDAADPIEITVHDAGGNTLVGQPSRLDQDEWTSRRMYEEERARLTSERRFVQYLPTNPIALGHEKALGDIRVLIAQYGQGGVWLWDPYLTAVDLLKTLFHSPHAMSDLRALTDAQSIPKPPEPRLKGWRRLKQCIWPKPPIPRPSFAEIQKQTLQRYGGNLEGLRLEYRGRFGQAGWGFHDRFLIFPQTQSGPLAWSLGTSVNMLGQKHHILQRVDDARLVADAFETLWDALGAQDQLIWKSP